MFVAAKNDAERKFVKQNEAKKLFFCFASKQNEKFEAKTSKKLYLNFCFSMRKQSETDTVLLRFSSKRKNFSSKTSAT
jgi:hypothetical protein